MSRPTSPRYRPRLLCRYLAPALCLSCLLPAFAADPTALPSSASTEPLRQLSSATQELYSNVSRSFIRVKIDQNPDSLIPPALRKDFEEFRKRAVQEGRVSPEEGSVISVRPKRDAANPRGIRRTEGAPPPPDAPTTAPAQTRPSPSGSLLAAFLHERARNTQDVEALGRIRQAMLRLDALRGPTGGETIGVVISDTGEALVLLPLGDPSAKPAIAVTLSDNKESDATLVGTNYVRGYSLIKLNKPAPAFTPLAAEKPAPGELLMCISSTAGAATWISAAAPLPLPPHLRRPGAGDDRFPFTPPDERPAFLFNASGQLAAVGFERHASPASALKREFATLREVKTLPHRFFGVRYAVIPADDPVRTQVKALGSRAALRVDEVIDPSPAARAGLRKGDVLIAIDKAPLSLATLQQTLGSIGTRNTPVQFTVLRDAKEVQIEIPVEKDRSERDRPERDRPERDRPPGPPPGLPPR